MFGVARSSIASSRADARPALIGNRLALVGVVLYFCEWIGIALLNIGNVPASQGTAASEVLTQYSEHGTALALMAGWLGLVLLGRILFVAAIRDGIHRSGAGTLLADFAVAAMTVSVVMEVAGWTVAAGGAYAAANGTDQATIVGIDGIANFLLQAIGAPLAAAVLAAGLAMLQSRLFPTWLSWLGVVAGSIAAVYGVIAGVAFEAGGSCAAALCLTGSILPGLAQALAVTLLAVWVWMIGAAVVLFRAASRPTAATTA